MLFGAVPRSSCDDQLRHAMWRRRATVLLHRRQKANSPSMIFLLLRHVTSQVEAIRQRLRYYLQAKSPYKIWARIKVGTCQICSGKLMSDLMNFWPELLDEKWKCEALRSLWMCSVSQTVPLLNKEKNILFVKGQSVPSSSFAFRLTSSGTTHIFIVTWSCVSNCHNVWALHCSSVTWAWRCRIRWNSMLLYLPKTPQMP